ncbi:CapA family protein [Candidatus Poriferisodalis sp.]|uniref:CapA family protein n=1 Tax=Candidatus Poriferisodalis sp. TaxID=3101277 RepID=UPI003B5C4414
MERAWVLVAGAAVLAAACSVSTVQVAPPPTTATVAPVPATNDAMDAAASHGQPAASPVATTISSPAGEAAPAATTTATPSTTEPDLRWTLLAGGDVLMDRSEAAGIDPFAGIEPPLDTADMAVVNVEMVISDRGEPADKEFVFRAPPSAAERIAAAGVDVANLANNHSGDYGPDALVDTVDLLEAEGVIALGAGATSPDAYRHRVIEVLPGVRVAFVGASMVVPLGFPATQTRAGIASAYQRDRVLANVRVAAGDADIVIAVVHWGVERMTCPDGRQRDFAFELLRNGADAVIGQHPHVLQPVVFGDGKLVAYSLGNFVWHHRSGITGETGVLQIDFDGDEIVGWSFHPHLLDINGAPVPSAEGGRVDRINDIISGDCARHQPPPIATPPTPVSGAG